MGEEFLSKILQLLDVSALYYAIQLIRCAMLSYLLFALIALLRHTVWKHKVFLKGALWGLLPTVLFAGKMKFFYENPIGAILFTWWTGILTNHSWACWLYFGVAAAYAARLLRKRRQLKRFARALGQQDIGGTTIYVTDLPVTPSAIGVFRPKIIMPKAILENYSPEDVQAILLHEKTHIRLGHLLFYFIWDALRVLLWMNPLLTAGTKLFREDMEEICDWVTIQKSNGTAYHYGLLLLKTMKLLQAENKTANLYAAFTGDKGYQNAKQRMAKIARYQPYKPKLAASILAASILCAAATAILIQNASYGRCNENDSIFIYGYQDGAATFSNYSESLHQMVSYDDNYVYVDREPFEQFLQDVNATGEVFLVFGGFYKLPGFVGIGYSCPYDRDAEGATIQIPYEKPEEDWMVALIKLL